MSHEISNIICDYLGLPNSKTDILLKTSRTLSKEERKYYYEDIKPKKKAIVNYFRKYYANLNNGEQEIIKRSLIDSLLDKGGEPDLSDQLVLDVVGRFAIYNQVNQEAKNNNIPMKVGPTSGGCLAFIVIIVTLLLTFSFILSKN